MAASNSKLDQALLKLSGNDATLTTLDLGKKEVKGAGRLADLLANSSLVYFKLDLNTRRLVDSRLNNLQKKSASLFSMMLPSLSLDDEPFELSLDESIACEDQSPSSKRQRA